MSDVSASSKEIDESVDEPAETSLADRYSDMESDLKLVSSDDLIFRIPSYALQASSPIIRNMLAIERSSPSDSPKVLDFSDPDIETGVVIQSFLDICIHQEFEFLNRRVADDVIAFIRKWEFDIEADRIQLALYDRVLRHPLFGYKHLFHAVTFENWSLCGLCISSLDATLWTRGDGEAFEDRNTMIQALDIRAQKLKDFQAIYNFGPRFAMAIIKAGDTARKNSSIDYQVMGKLFVEYMEIIADEEPAATEEMDW